MNETDADGQLPPVAVPLEAPGKVYLHEVAVVLLESADAIVEDATGLHERLAIQRSKPVRQHAGDESREESE